MQLNTKAIFISVIVSFPFLTLIDYSTRTTAQVIPDHSLPSNSVIVSPDGQNILINGGTQAGANLFHSFQQFNVSTGQFVLFNNGQNVTNIFSRVTGNNMSFIDGILSANGTANLFLINPNGITFGQNAQLLLGGSFVGTTASQVNFADGSTLDILAPKRSQLTVSAPIGLLFDSQRNGEIRVLGHRHTLLYDGFSPLISPLLNGQQTVRGLTLFPKQSFGLFASEILLDGAEISSLSGNITMGALKTGILNLDNQNYSGELGIITLRNRSAIINYGVTDSFSKTLIFGERLNLANGSIILHQNFFPQSKANLINLQVNNLEINQSLVDFPTGIRISQFVNGKGSDIHFSSENISISDGAIVHSFSFAEGQGGNITVESETLQVSGFFQEQVSGFGTFATATGLGGNVSLNLDTLEQNGGAITTATFHSGNAGNIRIVANKLNLFGNSPQATFPSGILSISFLEDTNIKNAGNAGSIQVQTQFLRLGKGSGIDSTSFSTGNAGTISIQATQEILVQGNEKFSTFLGTIQSQAENREQLNFSGAISSSVLTPVSLVTDGLLFSRELIGDAGKVIIQTPTLILSDNAFIAVGNVGQGDGGAIEIETDYLIVDRSSFITATSTSGNGGNISLNNNVMFLLNNSQINANAFQGRGGNIEINTEVLFQDPSSMITASSELGIDGEVNVNQLFDLQNLVAPLTFNPPQNEIELRVECTEIELIQSEDLHGARMLKSGYVAKLKPNSSAQPTSNGVEWKNGQWLTTRYFTQDELDSWQCSLEDNSLLQSEQNL